MKRIFLILVLLLITACSQETPKEKAARLRNSKGKVVKKEIVDSTKSEVKSAVKADTSKVVKETVIMPNYSVANEEVSPCDSLITVNDSLTEALKKKPLMYTVYVKEKEKTEKTACTKQKPAVKQRFLLHMAVKGDTYYSLHKKYKVDLIALKTANNNQPLKVGVAVKIPQ